MSSAKKKARERERDIREHQFRGFYAYSKGKFFFFLTLLPVYLSVRFALVFNSCAQIPISILFFNCCLLPDDASHWWDQVRVQQTQVTKKKKKSFEKKKEREKNVKYLPHHSGGRERLYTFSIRSLPFFRAILSLPSFFSLLLLLRSILSLPLSLSLCFCLPASYIKREGEGSSK